MKTILIAAVLTITATTVFADDFDYQMNQIRQRQIDSQQWLGQQRQQDQMLQMQQQQLETQNRLIIQQNQQQSRPRQNNGGRDMFQWLRNE